MKRNGCSRPFHKYQIITWVFFLISSSIHFAIVLPLTQGLVLITHYIISSGLLILTCVITLVTSLINPLDPVIAATSK